MVLLASATAIFALPNCPSDQTKRYHNCFGTYTYADGSKYVGEWKDDKRNGQATYTYADGSKYVGEYKDNKWNGLGFFILKSGDAEKASFALAFDLRKLFFCFTCSVSIKSSNCPIVHSASSIQSDGLAHS